MQQNIKQFSAHNSSYSYTNCRFDKSYQNIDFKKGNSIYIMVKCYTSYGYKLKPLKKIIINKNIIHNKSER